MLTEEPTQNPINSPQILELIMREFELPKTDENFAMIAFLLEEILLTKAEPEKKLEELLTELRNISGKENKLIRLMQITDEYCDTRIKKEEPAENQASLIEDGKAIREHQTTQLEAGIIPESLCAIPHDYLPKWFFDYMYLKSTSGPSQQPESANP